MDCIFQIGDIVEVFDKIDPNNQPTNIGTVKYIERDNDLPNLFWVYVIANEEVLNVNIHPTIGYYWEIFPSDSPHVKIISRATIS